MEISGIIIMILWGTMSLFLMIQYAPYCKDLLSYEQFIVGMVFILGAPIFILTDVLKGILDCYLPEGWDEDESH